MPIIIGVDIGGSHITSAGVDMGNYEIVPGTSFNGSVDSKAAKEEILQYWSDVINKTLNKIKKDELVGISFAMPGPFDYEKGIAMFKGNDKYESLYGTTITSELLFYLNEKNISLMFYNDASSFGVGGILIKKSQKKQKVVAITLGTGFGAAFLKNTRPIVKGNTVPLDGCLWDKIFLKGIADDYFSTRWFNTRYKELTANTSTTGVKGISTIKTETTFQIFQEFANSLSEFLLPYLLKFDADLLVLGGNIAKAHELFLPTIISNLKENKFEIPITIISNTEETNIIGASYLFNDDLKK